MSARRDVVVTGLGAVSPIGVGVPRFWEALVAGRNGVAPIRKFDPSGLRTSIAAEVDDFDPHDHADGRAVRTSDPSAIYLLAAAREALADAALQEPRDGLRVAVVTGLDVPQQSVVRGALALERDGPAGIDSFSILQGLPVAAGGLVAQTFDLRGPQQAVSAACASGAVALLQAAGLIRLGYADAAVAGCTQTLDRLMLAVCGAARAISRSDDPERASRPFDRDRDGFAVGEGAAALVLERADHAAARGARPYAALAGGAQTSSLAGPTVNPADDCAACMGAALTDAGVAPVDVDAVSAHATGTPIGDRQEAEALALAFGRRVPAFAAKSMLGHCMSASAGLETVATVLAIRDGIVPPTINHCRPDPACDVDCVPNVARELSVRVALKSSFGFGGVNACLVLTAPEA
jgi:3-oxoacyl-[acyl-carrier-protein] synthase II